MREAVRVEVQYTRTLEIGDHRRLCPVCGGRGVAYGTGPGELLGRRDATDAALHACTRCWGEGVELTCPHCGAALAASWSVCQCPGAVAEAAEESRARREASAARNAALWWTTQLRTWTRPCARSSRRVGRMAEIATEDLESIDSADVDWVETAKVMQQEISALRAQVKRVRAWATRWNAATPAANDEHTLGYTDGLRDCGHAVLAALDGEGGAS